MAITITLQPAVNSINGAYKPIVLRTNIGVAMPIVYCDIYFNDTYYKSISITDKGSLDVEFDIQDAVQEILKVYIAQNGSLNIYDAPTLFATCYCKIRGSSINGDGFTIPDPTIPIQATLLTPAVAGTGTQSNTFFVVISAQQHDDNPALANHLDFFKTGTWDALAWPLTHRNSNYRIAGSDYFPFLYIGTEALSCINIYYKKKDGTTGNSSNCEGGFPDCPLVVDADITWEANIDGVTQDFTLSWSSPIGPEYVMMMLYRISGSGSGWSNVVIGAAAGTYNLNLPLGLYDFYFRVYSLPSICTPVDSDIFEEQGIAAPCTPVDGGDFNPPQATETVTYFYSYPITGTAPFILSAITKPSWMTISIVGSAVVLGGTPPLGSAAVGQTVAFTVTNDCGNIDRTDLINTVELETGIQIQATWGETIAAPCSAFLGYVYLEPPNTFITTGIIVYTDPAMTSPLTGALFIEGYPSGNIYAIDPGTGLVGADTGLAC